MRHPTARLESNYAAATPMREGELTRAAIPDTALELASRDGLEGLTIGVFAERMQMSKGGVFAHFDSRKDLQVEVVREYYKQFEQEVFYPSLTEPRDLPRLWSMVRCWTERRIQEVTTDRIYISGAVEYDDCAENPARDELIESVTIWRTALAHAITQAKEEGHLHTEVGPQLMLFEMYSLELSLHHNARFLRSPSSAELVMVALNKLIQSYQI